MNQFGIGPCKPNAGNLKFDKLTKENLELIWKLCGANAESMMHKPFWMIIANAYYDGMGAAKLAIESINPFDDWCAEVRGEMRRRLGVDDVEFAVGGDPDMRESYDEKFTPVEYVDEQIEALSA